MNPSDQVKLLEKVWIAALNFAESLDEGQVEAYGEAELKALNKALEAAEFEMGDLRITRAKS
jgi:hypothetical protein